MAESTRKGRYSPVSHWHRSIWGAAAVLLLLPLVAMHFADEVVWTALDFAVFAAMLAGACGAYELATRLTDVTAYRAAIGVALLSAFLLLWINGAVGIVGSENNPANAMFVAVLAIAVLGAVIARMRPRGMARTMFTTALAQALVAGIAVFGDLAPDGPGWPFDVLVLSAFFTLLWLLAAVLFRHSVDHAINGT